MIPHFDINQMCADENGSLIDNYLHNTDKKGFRMKEKMKLFHCVTENKFTFRIEPFFLKKKIRSFICTHSVISIFLF